MGKEEKKMGTLKKIFILHGWAYSTEKWEMFNNLLKKEGFEPILLKIPGLTEKISGVWELSDYVEWLDKKLKGEKSPVVLGHSNGGRIALAYAFQYPEKLKRLILIDSAGIYHDELPMRVKRFVFKGVAKLGKRVTTSEKLRGVLYRATRESDYKNAPPEVRETMSNLVKSDLREKLPEVKTPTVLIWGQEDKVTPLKDGKLMHSLLKNSSFEVIAGAHHSPQFTHLKEVVEIIKNNT